MPNTKNSLADQFGDFVRKKRHAKGWTLEKLAEVTYGDIRRKSFLEEIENGKRSPNFRTADLILEALGSWIVFTE